MGMHDTNNDSSVHFDEGKALNLKGIAVSWILNYEILPMPALQQPNIDHRTKSVLSRLAPDVQVSFTLTESSLCLPMPYQILVFSPVLATQIY